MHIIYKWQSAFLHRLQAILGRILGPLLHNRCRNFALWNGIISDDQWRQTEDDTVNRRPRHRVRYPAAVLQLQLATVGETQLEESHRDRDCHFSSMASFIMPLAKWQVVLILLFICSSGCTCSPVHGLHFLNFPRSSFTFKPIVIIIIRWSR